MACIIPAWSSGKLGLNFAAKSCNLINYTDDTKFHTSDPSPKAVENDIYRDLANTSDWFQENGMKADPEKCQALLLGDTNHHISIKCADRVISISDSIKLVDVTIDNRLRFVAQIADICCKVGGQVNVLNRLKNILPCKTNEALYDGFILPSWTTLVHLKDQVEPVFLSIN